MRKRWFNGFLFMIFIFVLVACNSNKDEDLLFQGDGENWRTEVYTGQTTESPVKGIAPYVYLKFRGSNPNMVQELEYEVETDQGSLGGGDIVLNEQGEVPITAETVDKVVTSKTDRLTITVNWLEKEKEKTEIISLEKKKRP